MANVIYIIPIHVLMNTIDIYSINRELIYGTGNGIVGQLFANNTTAEKGMI